MLPRSLTVMKTDGPDRTTGARILVVDDEPQIVEIVRDNLTHAGFTVEVAYDGLDALEHARANPPDLVILDLMLPSITGWEVFRRLRRQTAMPILILTGKLSEHDRVLGFEAGADDYEVRPNSGRPSSSDQDDCLDPGVGAVWIAGCSL